MKPLATSLVTVFTVFAVACTLTTDLDGLAARANRPEPDDDDDRTPTTSGSSSGEKPVGSTSGTAASSTSSSSGSSSASSGSTTSSSSSGNPPAPLLIDERFPNEDACSGWAAENATTMFRPDLGHDEAGACQVCGTGGAFFLTKTVTAPKAGKLSVTMFARQGEGVPITSATMSVVTPNGTISSTKNVGQDFGSFSSGTATVKEGGTITVKIGLTNGTSGQCLVFDDIQATVN